MTGVAGILGLTVAMGLGTWFFGWWAVVVLAIVWGAIRKPRHSPGMVAAWGGGFSWAALLALMARQGPVGDMASLVGDITGLPGSGVMAVTVLFAAAVAGSGAALTCAVVERFNPEQEPVTKPPV